MKNFIHLTLAALIFSLPVVCKADDPKVDYHGAGWLQMGKVERSYTTPAHVINDYSKTWMQNAGAVFAADVKFDDKWDGKLGMGTVNIHLSRGKTSNANIWYPFWVPFITESQLTRTSSLFNSDDKFSLTMGMFPVNYNPDVKNLGLYLMRGYVYPGSIVSGTTGPLGGIAPTTGIQASYSGFGFQNDLVLISETEDKPLYDFSLADIVTLKPLPGLEFGIGVNLYRLIPQNSRLTSPKKDCNARNELGEYNRGCFELDSIGVDIGGNILYDTLTGSLAGTKVMGRFHVDPKPFLGLESIFNSGEMLFYGEVAVLGVSNMGKKYYNDVKRRMPVMLGFNLPTFKTLDNLSLEVEYYASKNSSDNLGAQYGSWVPNVDPDVNNARDDWKWSLNIDKVIGGNLKVSAQVANDHLRVGGYHNYATGVETTTTPKDWYWTTKAVYFF